MSKICALAGLAVLFRGCFAPPATWKGEVEWPTDEQSVKLISPYIETGTALAAAAALREMVKKNPHPHLFRGCSSPEQAFDVAVYTGPTQGLYYVVLDQRFDRCGGSRVRVLDGWYVYAVTPQGEVVAEAPPPADERESSPPPTSPPPSDQESPSVAPPLQPGVSPPPSPEVVPPPIPEATPQATSS